MSSKALSRMIFVLTMVVITFAQTAGGRAQGSQEGARQAVPPRPSVPVVITSSGRTVPEESLPAETRAQVERVRKAAESVIRPGANERIKVTVACSYPPLKCTITVEF